MIEHAGGISESLLNSPPYGARDAADVSFSIVEGRTGTAVIALKFPFFKYHLIVCLGYVW
jgi:hypothetical protein